MVKMGDVHTEGDELKCMYTDPSMGKPIVTEGIFNIL